MLDYGGTIFEGEEPPAAAEKRESQAEAARGCDLLARAAVGSDPIDLPALSTAPDASVGMHGDSLGMIEPRLDHPLVEDARRGHRQSIAP